jgi:hypothetical protein
VRIVEAEINPAANVILTTGGRSWKSDRLLLSRRTIRPMLLWTRRLCGDDER